MPLYQPRALPPHLPLLTAWLQSAGLSRAMLFGGALRDADNNRPIKDYDVLVAGAPSQSPRQIFSKLTDSHGAHGQIMPLMGDRYDVRLPVDDGQSIVIDLNFADRVWRGPDYKAGMAAVGLSGIVMDLMSGEVYASHAYQRDVANQTISLMGGGEDDMEAMQHADKVQGKYNWPIVDDCNGRIIRAPRTMASARALTPVS